MPERFKYHLDSVRSMNMLGKIKKRFDKKGACVARAENISMATTSGRDYDKVIDRLLKTKGATAVIVLLDSRQSRLLLEAANRKRTGGVFFASIETEK